MGLVVRESRRARRAVRRASCTSIRGQPSYARFGDEGEAIPVERLRGLDIPVVAPAGGHAVYLDARRFLPHIEPLQYPGQALSVELFIEAGIRGVEIGTVMFGANPHTGKEEAARLDLLRLAIPRRVYTQSHMDYVVEAIDLVWQRRNEIRGMQIVKAPQFLRHFTARFDWVQDSERRRSA